MPKSRSRKHKTAKKRQQQWRPKVKRKATAWAKLRKFVPHFLWSWRTFVAALGVVGGIVGLYSVLLPRITISSSESLNPPEPFQTYFEIRNDGYLGINSVVVGCDVQKMADPRLRLENTSISQRRPQADRIEPGGVATVRCPIGLPSTEPTTAINMVMIVTFRADYSPIRSNRGFRFVSVRAKDGTLRWQQQPE